MKARESFQIGRAPSCAMPTNFLKVLPPLRFGFDYINHQLVKNSAEQAAIRMMRQYRAGGLSLREIAGNLNLKLIPTKQNGVWQANTVREILARA
jgi:hypothetical protein